METVGRQLFASVIDSPITNLLAIADDNFLYSLSFITSDISTLISKQTKILNADILLTTNTILENTKKELDLYFLGKLQNFTIPIKTIGTDFQQKIWLELQNIPYGKTISYLELAKNTGNAKAFRAVANANGKNRLPIIIPCHRVINSNGKLGGFTGGLDKKIALLNIEKHFDSAE